MRHNVVGKKLNRDAAHRKSLKRNLSISLIEHGSIETTLPKAKFVKPFAEKLVTKAKKADLHAVRVLKRKLDNEVAVKKLVEEIGPKFAKREGGYTRIVKLGFRDGDKAEMARLSWVGEEKDSKKASVETKKAKKDTKPKKEVKEEKIEDATEEKEESEKKEKSND